MHLLETQAWVRGQSGFRVHSGLHSMYGLPNNPGRQTQAAAWLRSRHSALTPHGEGRQGSMISGLGGVAKILII